MRITLNLLSNNDFIEIVANGIDNQDSFIDPDYAIDENFFFVFSKKDIENENFFLCDLLKKHILSLEAKEKKQILITISNFTFFDMVEAMEEGELLPSHCKQPRMIYKMYVDYMKWELEEERIQSLPKEWNR